MELEPETSWIDRIRTSGRSNGAASTALGKRRGTRRVMARQNSQGWGGYLRHGQRGAGSSQKESMAAASLLVVVYRAVAISDSWWMAHPAYCGRPSWHTSGIRNPDEAWNRSANLAAYR